MKRGTLQLLGITLALSLACLTPAGADPSASRAASTALDRVTLQQCIQISLSDHPDIAAARARIEEKVGDEDEAISHTYPSLLGNGTYTHIDPVLHVSFGPFSFPIDTENSFSIGISVRYSVYNGGRLENAVKAAASDVSSSRYDLQKVMLDKVLGVRRSFYKVLLSVYQVRAARWFLNASEFNRATSEELYRTGAVQRLVFLNSVIRERGARESLASAEASYRVNLDNLAVAMGLKPGEVASVSGSLDKPSLPPFQGLLETAYRNRPDLKADESKIMREKARIEIAEATNMPDVSLFAGEFYFTRPFIPFVPITQNQAGVQVSWPFEFGKQAARVRQFDSKLEEARAKLEQDRHDISLRLSSAYSDAATDLRNIKAYARSVADSRISFEDSIAAFANGYIDSTQFDETQDLSNQSQINYLQSLYGYEEALSRISYILGENP